MTYTRDEYTLYAYQSVRDYIRAHSMFGYSNKGAFSVPATATYGEMWVLNTIHRLGLEFIDRVDGYAAAMTAREGSCAAKDVVAYIKEQSTDANKATFIIPVRAEMVDPGNFKAVWRLYDDLGLYYHSEHNIPEGTMPNAMMAYHALNSMLTTLLPVVWDGFAARFGERFAL
jgi:hypothetical protein